MGAEEEASLINDSEHTLSNVHLKSWRRLMILGNPNLVYVCNHNDIPSTSYDYFCEVRRLPQEDQKRFFEEAVSIKQGYKDDLPFRNLSLYALAAFGAHLYAFSLIESSQQLLAYVGYYSAFRWPTDDLKKRRCIPSSLKRLINLWYRFKLPLPPPYPLLTPDQLVDQIRNLKLKGPPATPLKACARAIDFMKSRQARGWCHKDIMKMIHSVGEPGTVPGLFVRCEFDGFQCALSKFEEEIRERAQRTPSGIGDDTHMGLENGCAVGLDSTFAENWEVLDAMKTIWELKTTPDEEEVAEIIRSNDFIEFKHVLSKWLTSAQVWESLMPKMSLWRLLQWLPSLTVHRIVSDDDESSRVLEMVIERLNSEDFVKLSRIQPQEVLLRWKYYESGGGRICKYLSRISASGKDINFRPEPHVDICRALAHTYQLSFANLPSLGDVQYCIAVNPRVMNLKRQCPLPNLCHLSGIRPGLAVACLVQTFTFAASPKLAPIVTCIGKRAVREVHPQPEDSLETVMQYFTGSKPANTWNMWLAIDWALNGNHKVDMFILATDLSCRLALDDLYAKTADALTLYKSTMNLPNAKAVIIYLTANAVQDIEEQARDDIMIIGGFNRCVPNLIRMFASGEF